jgi:hypothetical protein
MNMKELIPIINEIVKYGLEPDLDVSDKINDLEKNLVKIYALYFDIDDEFDEKEYADSDIMEFVNIRKNVETNFKQFGFYNTFLDIFELVEPDNQAIGDAIDDLADIIKDLLVIKWKIENNSLNDGLSFFKFIFHEHTQQHTLDLLNYMKQLENRN